MTPARAVARDIVETWEYCACPRCATNDCRDAGECLADRIDAALQAAYDAGAQAAREAWDAGRAREQHRLLGWLCHRSSCEAAQMDPVNRLSDHCDCGLTAALRRDSDGGGDG